MSFGDVSSQLPEILGELQVPSRLARQELQCRAPRTNQLGGVVLQFPRATGAPGTPLQTVPATQQTLYSSLTAINNVSKSKTLKNVRKTNVLVSNNDTLGQCIFFVQRTQVVSRIAKEVAYACFVAITCYEEVYTIAIYYLNIYEIPGFFLFLKSVFHMYM